VENRARYRRDGVESDYLQCSGDGDFGQAWIAWEEEERYFTSESGLRIQTESAVLFAKQCLDADTDVVRPVDRSTVRYLEELVT